MAKIQMGGIAAQVRGSIGNTTFSRNKGGAYIRARVAGVQPRSPKQTQVRANFANNTKAWSGTLTESQRTAWIAFAASNQVTDIFGASITLNGTAMYVRLNQVLSQIGEPTIQDPPVSYTVDPLPMPLSLNPTFPDGLTFSASIGAVVAGTEYYVFAAAPSAPGRVPTQSKYRFLGAFMGNSTGDPISIGSEYVTAFGDFASGQTIAADIGQVNTASGAVLPGVKFVVQA